MATSLYRGVQVSRGPSRLSLPPSSTIKGENHGTSGQDRSLNRALCEARFIGSRDAESHRGQHGLGTDSDLVRHSRPSRVGGVDRNAAAHSQGHEAEGHDQDRHRLQGHAQAHEWASRPLTESPCPPFPPRFGAGASRTRLGRDGWSSSHPLSRPRPTKATGGSCSQSLSDFILLEAPSWLYVALIILWVLE
jgi:hypothetical protein